MIIVINAVYGFTRICRTLVVFLWLFCKGRKYRTMVVRLWISRMFSIFMLLGLDGYIEVSQGTKARGHNASR
jgi:hypothetical protein